MPMIPPRFPVWHVGSEELPQPVYPTPPEVMAALKHFESVYPDEPKNIKCQNCGAPNRKGTCGYCGS